MSTIQQRFKKFTHLSFQKQMGIKPVSGNCVPTFFNEAEYSVKCSFDGELKFEAPIVRRTQTQESYIVYKDDDNGVYKRWSEKIGYKQEVYVVRFIKRRLDYIHESGSYEKCDYMIKYVIGTDYYNDGNGVSFTYKYALEEVPIEIKDFCLENAETKEFKYLYVVLLSDITLRIRVDYENHEVLLECEEPDITPQKFIAMSNLIFACVDRAIEKNISLDIILNEEFATTKLNIYDFIPSIKWIKPPYNHDLDVVEKKEHNKIYRCIPPTIKKPSESATFFPTKVELMPLFWNDTQISKKPKKRFPNVTFVQAHKLNNGYIGQFPQLNNKIFEF